MSEPQHSRKVIRESTKSMTLEQKKELFKAAKEADWQQVACNGGPPCFHVDAGSFCLRAERWFGHSSVGVPRVHEYVSLEGLLKRL